MKYFITFLSIVAIAFLQVDFVTAQNLSGSEVKQLKSIIGIQGEVSDGEYKITIPQNDLNVKADGFDIIPPMGMGSWVAFKKADEGIIIMGDLVLKEDEIKSVQKTLIDNNLTVTGLHNHFVREEPSVMYMHIGGSGEFRQIATSVKKIIDEIEELRGTNSSSAPSSAVENELDTDQITKILGHAGSMDSGVYKITIGRPDVNLTSKGTKVSSFMGFNTWAAWQGTDENAAVAGDFAMLENEVANVIQALVAHDIEIVAVHNHMVHEQPRIFFLHYWGVGKATDLAQGLRAALDKTGK